MCDKINRNDILIMTKINKHINNTYYDLCVEEEAYDLITGNTSN